jgi:small subunit ribosomal protein S6
MTCYECVYIARQELTAAQTEQLSDDLALIVTRNSGEVKNREYWGLKNLAYKIRKNRKGHYTLFHIESPSDTIVELERNMGLNEDILRYLTIKLDEIPEDQSVMMTAKSERGDRVRRPERFGERNSGDDNYEDSGRSLVNEPIENLVPETKPVN